MSRVTYDRYHELVPSDYKEGGGLNPHSAAIWSHILENQRANGIIGDFLEVGVWRGMTQAMLAMYRTGHERLISVDPFMKVEDILPALTKVDPDVRQHIDFVRKDSCDRAVAAELRNREQQVRFAHIDGEHSYEAVYNDLDIAAQLMNREGIIAVDDFFLYNAPSITRAVFEFTRREAHRLVLLFVGYNKAYCCHPRSYNRLLPIVFELVERLETFGLMTTLGTSDYSILPGSLSLFDRHGGSKYQVVMKRVDSKEEMLKWLGLRVDQ